MPFTVVGWYQSLDAAVLAAIDALEDQHVRIVDKEVIVPAWAPNLLGIYAWGKDIIQAQLVSPSLRALANLDIGPIDKADLPTSIPPFHDRFDTPIPLTVSEALTFLGAEDFAGAGEMGCFGWLGTEITPVPAGRIFTVLATETLTALDLDVWDNNAFTFDQTLPAGRYACVGARAQTTGLRAFRFVPVGESYRPGGIGFAANGNIAPPRFRSGRAGVWFEFEHNAPPTIDLMSGVADTSLKLWVDLIQIRAGMP